MPGLFRRLAERALERHTALRPVPAQRFARVGPDAAARPPADLSDRGPPSEGIDPGRRNMATHDAIDSRPARVRSMPPDTARPSAQTRRERVMRPQLDPAVGAGRVPVPGARSRGGDRRARSAEPLRVSDNVGTPADVARVTAHPGTTPPRVSVAPSTSVARAPRTARASAPSERPVLEPARRPGRADPVVRHAAAGRTRGDAPPTPPTIQVTIGRIEVRAQRPAPPRSPRPERRPTLTLERYAADREAGRR